MSRFRCFLAVGLLSALALPASASTLPKEGTYELATRSSAVNETIGYLIKLEAKDGALTASLAANAEALGDVSLKDVTFDADTLRFTIKSMSGEMVFEGRVGKAEATEILGSFGNDSRAVAARLTITDKTTVGQRPLNHAVTVPEPMKKAMAVSSRAMTLRLQAQRTQDADEKAKLLEQATEAAKTAQTEVPKLYREVIEKHADNPAAGFAALDLIRRAATAKSELGEVRSWARVVAKFAKPYGPRFEAETAIQLAEILGIKKDYAIVGVEYASQAAKALDTHASAEKQDRVLTALVTAQRNAGQIAVAAETDIKLAKVQEILDKEYLAKMPPFKPEAYAGRKAKSDRVAVLELFTGAQCPPCVAADLAFDALEKTYKPSELVLIQYHLHIPGPDPLTNAASEARWSYYRDRFKEDVRGTPTTAFNGKPQAGGGGGIARAEVKYNEYRKIIDELLEEPAKGSIALRATRSGDAITLKADVSKLPEPGPKLKLRFALLEETVRYAGGNKLRFHHMVLRALPGGADGIPLNETLSTHSVKAALPEIKVELTKYLDEFVANRGSFPRPDRPMALKHLKAIAFIQDDDSGEILQAALVDVDRHGEAVSP